jgi:transposase InsO family protein
MAHFDPKVGQAVLQLKAAHPGWGAPILTCELQRQARALGLSGLKLPARATVSRLLHEHLALRRKPKPAKTEAAAPAQAQGVLEIWELDFKMGIPLADGTQVNLHTVCDIYGSVCVAAHVTPAGLVGDHPSRVTVPEVQDTLRRAFASLGTLPKIIRTDNEALFVGHSDEDLLSQFTMWLMSLGIEHQTTRPATPTDNPHVERCHQKIYNYAIAGRRYLTITQLQQELDQAVVALFLRYTSRAAGCNNRIPAEALPELLAAPRPYQPEHESERFDLAPIARYLAARCWRRRVNSQGQISLGGRHRYYHVGREHAGKDVLVAFDPTDHNLVFFALQSDNANLPDAEIGRRLARFLTKEHITGDLRPLQCHPFLALRNAHNRPLPLVQGVFCLSNEGGIAL